MVNKFNYMSIWEKSLLKAQEEEEKVGQRLIKEEKERERKNRKIIEEEEKTSI